jgi:K+-transporting ATPase ATPase C chain
VITVRQHLAALRILLVLTVVTGVLYPAVITLAAQLPGLKAKADGSLVKSGGRIVGSALIGQDFTGKVQYLQGRPSASTDDPTASGASNLGPESVTDTLADPSVKGDTGTQSLLTQVCARSLAIGQLEHVDGSRPFCTPDGVGAVLAVVWSGPGFAGHVTRAVSEDQACPATPFLATYEGVKVECARFGEDLSRAEVVPIRGDAPSHPVVPADAVTASGSGLDPDISPAYAALQEPRIAHARGMTVAQVDAIVRAHTSGRGLGFIGEGRVDVLAVNRALDGRH